MNALHATQLNIKSSYYTLFLIHTIAVCMKYVSLFRKTNLEFIFPFQDPVWMGSTRTMHCV